jgi:hypothetical protein
MTQQENIEIKHKIQKGLELTYEKLVAETRAKNGELIVMRDNKIVTIKP